ncbi:MAG: class I SAM-dependent methyltransferase [Pseudomonadales bacterium]
MVANRLRKNRQRLKGWLKQAQIGCYRAYDADLPEYAAAIDVYTPAATPALWLHVQEYQAPASVDATLAEQRFEALIVAAAQAFEVPMERIVRKRRLRAKGGSKYGRMDHRGDSFVVCEGAVKLEVNLFDYLDTGLFLDHRAVRRHIGKEIASAPGPVRFLNLFCYTGAVTAHAALAGAQTVSVDLSATYLDWARRNLQLNDCETTDHTLVKADVMRWLEQDRGQYDLIFCDPPTFSNSKSAADFDVQREHVRLLELCVARLAPGGRLLFSNNYRRFRLDQAAVQAFAQVIEITASTIDRDFARNPKIHCCFELRATA